METKRPIVVGVDGSEPSRAALVWAAAEARLRHCPLSVVHAWESPTGMDRYAADATVEVGLAARDLLDGAIRETLGDRFDVEIHRDAVHGAPASALCDAAADADLLVVGSRGRGGFGGLLLGSVSKRCAAHAACPVVIVRAGGVAERS